MLQIDSVVDRAYERIRELVLSGEIAPGAKLGQVELAERLGISRTPVREALRRLSAEGLVEPLPNRGFAAADLGLDAVLRRLEVRAILEPGIARLAAERRTPPTSPRSSAASPARSAPAPAPPPTTPRATSISPSPAPPATRSTSASSNRSGSSRSAAACSPAAPSASEWQGTDASEHRAIFEAVRDAAPRRSRPADGGPRPRRRPALGEQNLKGSDPFRKPPRWRRAARRRARGRRGGPSGG